MFDRLSNKEIILAASIILGVIMVSGIIGALIFIPMLTGNGVASNDTPNSISKTLSYRQTQQVYETAIAQLTKSAETQETSIVPITGDATPTATQAAPTATQLPPTPTKTPVPIPCSAAQFIRDVSAPDGAMLMVNQEFIKTWRLKNIGSCTWNTDYRIVFSSGNAMNGPASQALSKSVRPGETIDISIKMRAPSKPGEYIGNWMLRDDMGRIFGLGANADRPFWVSIEVSQFTSEEVPDSEYPLDFTAEICEATWRSGSGSVSLPCTGSNKAQSAWAAILTEPKFENGHIDDERTIWMHPDDKKDWVEGIYPVYEIKEGDHFKAWIGCLYDNENCDVVFTLNYKKNGEVYNLGSWRETYDQKIRTLNIDLSYLEGEKVEFILRVDRVDYNVDANAFWFVPSIQRMKTPTPTATATSTQTPTFTPTEAPTLTPTPTELPTPTETETTTP